MDMPTPGPEHEKLAQLAGEWAGTEIMQPSPWSPEAQERHGHISARVLDAHVYTYHPAAIPTWPPGRSPLDESSQLLRRGSGGIHFAGDYTENAHSDGAARSAKLRCRWVSAVR